MYYYEELDQERIEKNDIIAREVYANEPISIAGWYTVDCCIQWTKIPNHSGHKLKKDDIIF